MVAVHTLPGWASVLAVCAHPDDESFGLGAVLSTLADAGCRLSVLCFTHGEASTLRSVQGDLDSIRAGELAAAGTVLGVAHVELLDYPDGHLSAHPLDELGYHVTRLADTVDADALLVFDDGGITGHPDHQHATDAAVEAAHTRGLVVLAWAIPNRVAARLNDEFQTTFVGRDDDFDVIVTVDRRRQLDAITCHRSQSADNPVLTRRLELLGPVEYLRYLDGARPISPTTCRLPAAR
jgi:N-acetylglucosamine malate deacetylase 2